MNKYLEVIYTVRRLLLILLALFLAVPSLSCAETIVTSFYPVWLLTLNLTDGLEDVMVRNLAAPDTGCLHDYTLRPSDMAVLSRADALLINGAGMESFLDVVTAACPGLPVVSAWSENVPPLGSGDAEEIGEPEEGEELNSHIWLDPLRAVVMAENLADGLIRIMPEHREAIAANLEVLKGRLTALDAEMKTGLAGVSRRDVIIMHEAFPYLAEACGLHIVAVVNKEPEDDLPAASLARLIRLIRDCEIAPLVIKSAESDPAAAALVAETGAPVCELDPITTGPDNPPLDYYEAVMLRNMQSLQNALQ